MKKCIRFSIFALLVLFCGLIAYFGFHYWQVQKPVQKQSEEVIFTIDRNTKMVQIVQHLKKEGLISNAFFTEIYIKLNHLNDFKAGTFKLNKNMSLAMLLNELRSLERAKAGMAYVDIIDGYWLKDIAHEISAKTGIDEKELFKLWQDQDWLKKQMKEYPFLTNDIFNTNVRYYLEGYFYPARYYFHKKTNAKEITKILLNKSLDIFKKHKEEFTKSSLSVKDVYTLASIIQYESGSKLEEGKMVAGIFMNRLRAKIPLGSSSSICYAMDIERKNGDWKACEVNSQFDSPYNTYKHTGLPPGPINSPSEIALQAALKPQDSEYQFFMHDVKDGKIYYAKTYEEHLKNIKEHLNLKS